MNKFFDVHGKTALVTGSSRGIGFSFAQALHQAGAKVLLHGSDSARLDDAIARMSADSESASAGVLFDVTDPVAVEEGVDRAVEQLGSLDILVNCAGIQRRSPIDEFTNKDWDDLLAVNLSGTFYCARAASRHMKAAGRGKIVNIASVQSKLARPGIAPYSATKGGVVMLTQGLCADLARYGISVNALAPGYIETELTRALVEDEEFSRWLVARTPAGRWGSTEDLLGALLFLASPASDFVNGQTLFVDGGMTAVV